MSPNAERQDWRVIVGVFWITSMVEGLGVSQIFALVPSYLREMGVPEADRLPFVGLFGALLFVVGMPLVPLWGVWADKYSRKAVIVRSALVEAVVFACVALSREPWQLAGSMLLIGLQLGNTGVMLAGIRDITPRRRLGTTIALFGAASPIGFAVGPALAGILIDGAGWSISAVFWVSSVLSIATGALVWFGSREVRPEVIPTGRVIDLAFGAVRGVLADPTVRRIFAIFAISFLANQMARPYIPVLVERLAGTGPGLASAIALVAGTAALVGALVSPLGGALGDRVGFRPVLVGALVLGGVAVLAMPFAPGVGALALVALVFAAATAAVSAMIFGLLATEVPAERRSATLNLVYLPLYAAGIVGPATGAVVVATAGLSAPFLAGALVFIAGAAAIALSGPSRRALAAPASPPPTADDDRDDRLAERLVREWLGPAATRTPLQAMNSSTWRVDHRQERYVLKIARPEDAPGLALATWLEGKGLPTGAPTRTALSDGRLAALLRYVDGDGMTEADADAIGETLGRVHRALLSAPLPAGVDRWPWRWLDPSRINDRALRAAAERAIARAEEIASNLTHGPLHGDPAPEAFLRTPDGPALIDWGAALHGPLLYDVASAVMYAGEGILPGYARTGPLDQAELDRLGVFLHYRWAVQAWYFSDRLARNDLTGLEDKAENDKGLADAARGLLGRSEATPAR
jgi:MFS family permease